VDEAGVIADGGDHLGTFYWDCTRARATVSSIARAHDGPVGGEILVEIWSGRTSPAAVACGEHGVIEFVGSISTSKSQWMSVSRTYGARL